MAKARQLAGQPVTTGFIVRKSWHEEKMDPDNPEKVLKRVPHVKTVSQPYMSRDAAGIFRDLALKNFNANPVSGQLDVEFFVTENKGQDGLPKGF